MSSRPRLRLLGTHWETPTLATAAWTQTEYLLDPAQTAFVALHLWNVGDEKGPPVPGMFFVDMGIAGEHIVLQAEELGLATCWLGWINYRRVRKVLRVPRKFKIVAMMPLGYAEKRPQREPPRRGFDEVAFFNRVPDE